MAKAKKKTAKKAGKKRARKVTRQTQVPGTERPHLPDISAAAETYQELKVHRMATLEEEVKAKEVVLDLMKEHGLESYVDDELDLEVVLEVGKVNVKVRQRKAPDEDAEA